MKNENGKKATIKSVKYKKKMTSFTNTVVDEIALEGLDGVTLSGEFFTKKENKDGRFCWDLKWDMIFPGFKMKNILFLYVIKFENPLI